MKPTMKYLIPNIFADNSEFSYQLGQLVFESTGNRELIQDIADVPEMRSTELFTFCDLFPSFIPKVPLDKKICVIRLHPDIAWLYNQVFTNFWRTEGYSLQVYFSLVNYRPQYFDLETKETTLPFDLRLVKLSMPMLQTVESDFLKFQDYMKHLPIEDHLDFQTEESTYLEINGKRHFNAYEVLGYSPLSYADLVNLQGTCV